MHSVSSASGLYAQLMAQQHAPGGALWSPGRRGSWAVATDLAMDDEHMSAVCVILGGGDVGQGV